MEPRARPAAGAFAFALALAAALAGASAALVLRAAPARAAVRVGEPRGDRYPVTFRFAPATAVSGVTVAGSFNGWDRTRDPLEDPDRDGVYERTIELPAGRHAYKFVTGGTAWHTDPDNAERESDGCGGWNSVVLVGEASGRASGAIGDGAIDAAEVYHGPEPGYRHRDGRERVVLRLRTLRGDVARATLRAGGRAIPMRRAASFGRYDVFEAEVQGGAGEVRYVFALEDGKALRFYGPKGIAAGAGAAGAFAFGPGDPPPFETPEWARRAVFYQIFPERFRNGDPSNDPRGTEPWGSRPTLTNFMGGDLAGVLEELDALRDLGATAIYLNPIFKARSNHKYDTQDYLRIDPGFGDEALFRKLCAAARERGIAVVLDGVFNHTGDGFWAFEDLKRRGKESPYRDWYTVRKWPIVVKRNPDYEAWWGYGELPKLNMKSPEVRAHILEVAAHWLEAGAAGWRLDVPNEVPQDFWVEFRREVKRARPDAYICGEIWADATPWLGGDQFDGVMNYPLREAALAFFRSAGEADARAFDEALARGRMLYPRPAIAAAMNLLGSHDTARLRTVLGGEGRRVALAYAFLFTYVGAPQIYYGDEIGLEGEKDPDCRAAFPWDEKKWEGALRARVRLLARLRREIAALASTDFETLLADGPLFAYRRGEALVALNASDAPRRATFLAPAGAYAERLRGGRVAAKGGRIALDLPPLEAAVLVPEGAAQR